MKYIDKDMLARKSVAVAGLFVAGGSLAGTIPGKTGLVVTLIAGLIVGLGRSLTTPSGVATPISPGQLTVIKAVWNGVIAVVEAPRNRRLAAAKEQAETVFSILEPKIDRYVQQKTGQTGQFVRTEQGIVPIAEALALGLVKIEEAPAPATPISPAPGTPVAEDVAEAVTETIAADAPKSPSDTASSDTAPSDTQQSQPQDQQSQPQIVLDAQVVAGEAAAAAAPKQDSGFPAVTIGPGGEREVSS